ncbi:hypothetical protein GGX14DRAFT_574191 [Mycena pura]|uniref:Uncharacterized protein n=1 Tax=Mycena pura TaxID=153505 RepID=A0AAD6Y5B5_9AGAR|nr:hypothetical protein GGX14DRAFT_574191 [Mycena pura]
MATILFNSVGKAGTLAIWALIIITLWMSGMDFLIAGSRQTKTPLHAVVFLGVMAILLGLLSFAGPLAISAVFTMIIACQYICFTTSIIARWVGGQKFVPGPFNLGFLSAPVSFIASAYMIFIILVFMFPAIPGPTSLSMNYTVVVVGGTVILSLGYYFFPKYGGRHWFIGPVETIGQVLTHEGEKDSSGSSSKPSSRSQLAVVTFKPT